MATCPIGRGESVSELSLNENYPRPTSKNMLRRSKFMHCYLLFKRGTVNQKKNTSKNIMLRQDLLVFYFLKTFSQGNL